jgi:hypothetical protein
VLEHLPPEPGAAAGIHVDVVLRGEAPAEGRKEGRRVELATRGGGE